jgi:hypothetical protein
MAQQLLWIETLLKLCVGGLLLVMPLSVAKLLGLPQPQTPFWSRLSGAVLLGLAAATFLEGSVSGSRGLGLGGVILVNLSTAGVLTALQVLGRGSRTRRGGIVIWTTVVVLVGLALFEVAVA